ncbi:MAG: hypothetical protein O3B87_03575 [bacterium]|nr:hypothetical protein [bacterium]
MFKRSGILIAIFGVFFIVNIAISWHLYASSVRKQTITVILGEFDELSGNVSFDVHIDALIDSNIKDKRVAILKSFFRKYDSPLYEHADFIVKVSDKNGLDYRLIPAIAMQESTACKFIPYNSYNCWGWGIYGSLVTRFDSYPEAIETVAAGLKKGYIDQGLTTPEEIMAKYTPSSNGSWAKGVGIVLGALE